MAAPRSDPRVSVSYSSLLTDPHPCRHIVYPYNDEGRAIYAVALFTSSGLAKGESVVLFVADARCGAILDELSNAGVDVELFRSNGQLECVSAEETLQQFQFDGVID